MNDALQLGNDDANARERALAPDQSFIVQAPAGSGKTSLLVYRILNLLCTVERPEQILAITFTKKATREMRQRVIEMLEMASRGEQGAHAFEQRGLAIAKQVLQRNKEKDWNLLDSPQQLQILTIDAFCAKLTGDMPWLSRLGDKPRTTEKANEHYAAAVEQLMNCLLTCDKGREPNSLSQALVRVMESLDFNYQSARKLFTEMLGKRDQWLRHLLQQDEVQLKQGLHYAWQQVTDSHLEYLSQQLPIATQQELFDLGKKASEVLAGNEKYQNIFAELDAYDELPRILNLNIAKAFKNLLLTKSNSYRATVNVQTGFIAKSKEKDQLLELLGGFGGDEELREALVELDILPSLDFDENDWQQLMALKEVLIALAGFLQLRFRAAGEVDFNEVTHRANLALADLQQPTDLALRLDYQIQHILVDEFQDTSHSQIELLKKLTAAWDHSTDSQSTTLFLVGDPMQSIYRFREADVGLFLRVNEDAKNDQNNQDQVFDNLQLQSLALSENFRSNKSLVDWFNKTFSCSFPKRNELMRGAITYAPATSNKAEVDSPTRIILAQHKQQEVSAVIAEVQKAIQDLSDESANDKAKVAVLVQSRPRLAAILPALQQANIPFVGVELQTLNETPAIIDIISLCRALSRLDDRVAWLALLRGPWCGVTLAEMKQIIGADTQNTLWALLQDHKTESARVQTFMQVMHYALQQKGRVTLHELAYWTWQQLGGQATLNGVALEDAELVFSLLAEMEKGGDIDSVTNLEQSLQSLYAQTTSNDAKVIVSTMHKAKGLQYDTVILPGLDRRPRNQDKSMMLWAEEIDEGGGSKLLLAPYSLANASGSHYGYLQELEKKREQNQTVRLMYVACTRAERQLILTATTSIDDEGFAKAPTKNSMLASIWSAIENQAQLLPEYPVSEEDVGLPQNLSRLPSGFKLPAPNIIEWSGHQQLVSHQATEEDDQESTQSSNQETEFDWATSLATAVGIVLHDWLQVHQSNIMNINVDDTLKRQWRADLLAQQLSSERINAGIKRLKLGIQNIQTDPQAKFIFADYPEQQNEYSLASYEQGQVKTRRIDRTFVDEQGVRWVVDYKTTYTENSSIEEFLDEQMQRHTAQLNKYGELMSHIDNKPIKLAVYFPLLKQLRVWDYET